MAASLGQAGFGSGYVFAGSGADANIYHFSHDGTSQNLFTTLPGGSGGVRQIFFDPRLVPWR